MALEIVAVLKEEEGGSKIATPAPAEDKTAEVRIPVTIKVLFDLLWKLGLILLLIGKTYFNQGTMEKDIAETKAHVEKQQADVNNNAQRLSALEANYKSIQQNVNSNAEFLRLIEHDQRK